MSRRASRARARPAREQLSSGRHIQDTDASVRREQGVGMGLVFLLRGRDLRRATLLGASAATAARMVWGGSELEQLADS